MKLSEIFKARRPVLSFEVFPPKPDLPIDSVFQAISALKDFSPSFISVTYGAGGSSRTRTVEIASRIKQDFCLEPMAHLTCVGHTKIDVDKILAELEDKGLVNILALRGDPPRDQPNFDYNKGEFKFAIDLIRYIRLKKPNFSIAAAAYPEGHKACPRIRTDWEHLKDKVDAGVDLLITQLFYDNRLFYHFLETVRNMGINCPIVPGIMPVFHAKQIKRILSLCGASMPPEILIMLDKYENNPDDLKKAGVEYAIKQINDLLDNGVDGIHLEPMNKPELAADILKDLRHRFC